MRKILWLETNQPARVKFVVEVKMIIRESCFTVPPQKLDILDDKGVEARNHHIGPYKENATVFVTCLASGGTYILVLFLLGARGCVSHSWKMTGLEKVFLQLIRAGAAVSELLPSCSFASHRAEREKEKRINSNFNEVDYLGFWTASFFGKIGSVDYTKVCFRWRKIEKN